MLNEIMVKARSSTDENTFREDIFRRLVNDAGFSVAVALYRACNPTSRATHYFTYYGSTSLVRRLTCIFCGSVSTSSARWNVPVHQMEWTKEHKACETAYIESFKGTEVESLVNLVCLSKASGNLMSLGMLAVENPKVTYKRIDKRRLREYALSVHITASTGGVSGEVPVYIHALKAKDLVGEIDSMHCSYYGSKNTTVPWGVILNYPANRPKEIRGEKDPDIERDIGIVYDTMMEVTQRLLVHKKEQERRRKVIGQVQAWCERLGAGLWQEARDAINYQERIKALRAEVTGEIHRQVQDKYTEEYIAAVLTPEKPAGPPTPASNNLEPEVVGAVHQLLADAAEQYLSPIRVPFTVSEEDVFGKEEDKKDE